jgi:hypothetical protein
MSIEVNRRYNLLNPIVVNRLIDRSMLIISVALGNLSIENQKNLSLQRFFPHPSEPDPMIISKHFH